MSIKMLRLIVSLTTALCVSIASPIQHALADTNTVTQVSVISTGGGLQVVVTNTDENGYLVPDLSLILSPGAKGKLRYAGKVGCEQAPDLPCGTYRDYWDLEIVQPPCSSTTILAQDENQMATTYSRPCTSIRGVAYQDLNENGLREPAEPIFGGAWYKVTDGGQWFVCGTVGGDGSYGIPLREGGTYYVVPINLKGYRTTTPRVRAWVSLEVASLGNDIGYVKDESSQLEGCDQYNPSRRAMPSLVEAANRTGKFTVFMKLAQVAGLVPVLMDQGPFTVVMPTDAAFSQVPKETVESGMASSDRAREVLSNLIIVGRYHAAALPTASRFAIIQGWTSSQSSVDRRIVLKTESLMAENGNILILEAE